jgi:hypothetical protein
VIAMSRKDQLIWFDVDVFQDALDVAIGEAVKATRAAIFSTMAKTRKHSKTQLSTIIREKWNIKKKNLDQRIGLKIGSRGGDYYESFEIIISGKSISIAYFSGTRQATDRLVVSQSRHGYTSKRGKNKTRNQGVQVELIKGRKRIFPRAWLHFASGGHVALFQRSGKGTNMTRIKYHEGRKKKEPVVSKAVISPASMLEDAVTADRFEEDIIDYLERTFAHELEWRLKQAGL